MSLALYYFRGPAVDFIGLGGWFILPAVYFGAS